METSIPAAATAKDTQKSGRNAIDLFTTRVKESAAKTALRWKEGGVWRESTWSDWDQASRELAAGLISLGLSLGDRAAVLGNTRPEWLHADIGILMAGAICVPIYQSN